MNEFILLMHSDTSEPVVEKDWSAYLKTLGEVGVLRGGSAIGDGISVRRQGAAAPISTSISGFIRIEVQDIDQARSLLKGNPVFEAGGTVEIRELPVTG